MTLGHLGPQDRLAMYGKSLLGPHIWGFVGLFLIAQSHLASITSAALGAIQIGTR